MSSASYKRETVHAAQPDLFELKPICYHYNAGLLSYDGMKRALLERRVVRNRGFNCRYCHMMLTRFPQLRVLMQKRLDGQLQPTPSPVEDEES